MLENPVRRSPETPPSVAVPTVRREIPLSALRPGDAGTVSRIDTGNPRRLHKLLALGIMPGCAIELRHRYPSFVFTVGQTQFAIDEQMAEAILVKRAPEGVG